MKDPDLIVKYALSEQRLKLNSKERSNHYHYTTFLSTLAIMCIIIQLFTNIWDYIFLGFAAVLIIFAIAVYIIRKRMLEFMVIETNMSLEQQCSYLQWVIEDKLKWKIDTVSNSLIIAETPCSAGSAGELVTIVFDNGRILLNSIINPKTYLYQSLTAWGWNKHNLNILTEYIGDTLPSD